jgi:hypothetical protein
MTHPTKRKKKSILLFQADILLCKYDGLMSHQRKERKKNQYLALSFSFFLCACAGYPHLFHASTIPLPSFSPPHLHFRCCDRIVGLVTLLSLVSMVTTPPFSAPAYPPVI